MVFNVKKVLFALKMGVPTPDWSRLAVGCRVSAAVSALNRLVSGHRWLSQGNPIRLAECDLSCGKQQVLLRGQSELSALSC